MMTLAHSTACFVFDADLNVVSEPAGIVWPVAIVSELRACVRRARAHGDPAFVLPDDRVRWRILDDAAACRLTVFPELLACDDRPCS